MFSGEGDVCFEDEVFHLNSPLITPTEKEGTKKFPSRITVTVR